MVIKHYLRFFQKKKPSMYIVLASLVLLILVLPLTLFLAKQQQETRQYAAGTGRFQVVGTKIYDPNGNQFIIKGATIVHEFFNGDNGNGQTNFNNAQRDLAVAKGLGINLARIFVSADIEENTSNPEYRANFFQQLDTVV